MQSLQLRGPFQAGQIEKIELSNVYRILKIGIEHPHSIPIQYYQLNNDSNIKTYIKIDGETYTITDNDILEFDGLYQTSITLQFLQYLDEYTIVDLTFVDVDDES